MRRAGAARAAAAGARCSWRGRSSPSPRSPPASPLHLQLPIARRVAARLISQLVSDEIRGELQIGLLERVSAREVVARDVILFDGEGRRVIEAERLRLVPDLQGAARRRSARFASARLDRRAGPALRQRRRPAEPDHRLRLARARARAAAAAAARGGRRHRARARRRCAASCSGSRACAPTWTSARGRSTSPRRARPHRRGARHACVEPFGFVAPTSSR